MLTALLTMLACKPGHPPCSLLAQSQVNTRCLTQSEVAHACLLLCCQESSCPTAEEPSYLGLAECSNTNVCGCAALVVAVFPKFFQKLGRKYTMMIGAVCFCIGAALQVRPASC